MRGKACGGFSPLADPAIFSFPSCEAVKVFMTHSLCAWERVENKKKEKQEKFCGGFASPAPPVAGKSLYHVL